MYNKFVQPMQALLSATCWLPRQSPKPAEHDTCTNTVRQGVMGPLCVHTTSSTPHHGLHGPAGKFARRLKDFLYILDRGWSLIFAPLLQELVDGIDDHRYVLSKLTSSSSHEGLSSTLALLRAFKVGAGLSIRERVDS